jgi:hypothetical protein
MNTFISLSSGTFTSAILKVIRTCRDDSTDNYTNQAKECWYQDAHAAFRFFSLVFFRWYAASRLSSSLLGTAITCRTRLSKREYSSDFVSGLDFVFGTIIATLLFGLKGV